MGRQTGPPYAPRGIEGWLIVPQVRRGQPPSTQSDAVAYRLVLAGRIMRVTIEFGRGGLWGATPTPGNPTGTDDVAVEPASYALRFYLCGARCRGVGGVEYQRKLRALPLGNPVCWLSNTLGIRSRVVSAAVEPANSVPWFTSSVALCLWLGREVEHA